uniref:Mitochondrial fission factor n=1 Tax=Colobus angolensis palliatus TaxID=336983 RepID=A0A2K5JT68_COLAP
MSENAVHQNGQLVRNDSLPVYGISNTDAITEGTSDDLTVVDAASLRRQMIKLNRCLPLLEEKNEKSFWLLNSWLWFCR